MAGLKWDFNASTVLALVTALVMGALWIQAQTTVEPLKSQYSEVLVEVRALRKDFQELSLKVERQQVKLEDGRRAGGR